MLEFLAGRSSLFVLNRDHLLVDTIEQIASAKHRLIGRLADVISTWDVQPLTVKLFGSAARDEMASDSDIDILFIMRDGVDLEEIEAPIDELMEQASRWTGNDMRPLEYVASEVVDASIYESILREGIDVAGDTSWLRRQLREAKRSA